MIWIVSDNHIYVHIHSTIIASATHNRKCRYTALIRCTWKTDLTDTYYSARERKQTAQVFVWSFIRFYVSVCKCVMCGIWGFTFGSFSILCLFKHIARLFEISSIAEMPAIHVVRKPNSKLYLGSVYYRLAQCTRNHLIASENWMLDICWFETFPLVLSLFLLILRFCESIRARKGTHLKWVQSKSKIHFTHGSLK